jgi:hypothetical protein
MTGVQHLLGDTLHIQGTTAGDTCDVLLYDYVVLTEKNLLALRGQIYYICHKEQCF